MADPAGPARPARDHRAGHLLALLVLAVVPLGLRLWPVAHGAPHSYVPDTHVVKNALGMAATRDLVPRANEFSSYPYLLSYALLPVYVGQYAVGRLAGEWGGGEEFGHRLKEEPHRAHLPARVVVALLSALAAFAALGAARAAGLGRGAWVAAWLAGTSLLHVQLSVQERPWAPLAVFTLLAAWPAATHARTGAGRSLLLSGVFAALAFATHQAGVLALGITGIAWAAAPGRWGLARVRRGALAVLVFVLVAVPLGHPYWVKYGPTDASQVAANELVEDEDVQLKLGAQQMVLRVRPETTKALTRAFVGYDPALLVLALSGLLPALRRRAFLPATLFALGWGALFLTNQNDHVRYLVPLALVLCVPAGVAGELFARSRVGLALLLPLLALPLVQALRLGHVLRQEDTRAIALEQLATLPPGTRIAIDVYGPPAPKDARALATTQELREARGATLYGREAHRLAYYAAGAEPPGPPGLDALGVEDVFEYDLRHGGSWVRPELEGLVGATTADALSALDVTHLLLVDRTPADGRPPMLVDPTPSVPPETAPPGAPPVPKLAPLELGGEPLWVVDPSAPGERALDARLPTAMRFPLVDLWRVARPGPRLELWKL